jgi:hypothetical protein
MRLDSDTNIKDDLGGATSLKFKPGVDINGYCASRIPDFDANRFEVVAIRLYYGKETAVTLYARDKTRTVSMSGKEDKVPVRKFKLGLIFLQELLPYVEEMNTTLLTGNVSLDNMEVMNK